MSDDNIERSKIVISEMMNDRGYYFSKNEDDNIIYTTSDKNKNTVIIFINDKKNITNKKIYKYVSDYNTENNNIILVVTFIDINENLPSKYNNYETSTLQVFHIKNLLFNITKHKYVPKHTILTKDEEKALNNMYNIENIAKMKVSDPVCRYYFAKSGDIMKITRLSNNSKEEINYRLCI